MEVGVARVVENHGAHVCAHAFLRVYSNAMWLYQYTCTRVGAGMCMHRSVCVDVKAVRMSTICAWACSVFAYAHHEFDLSARVLRPRDQNIKFLFKLLMQHEAAEATRQG